MHKPRLSLSLPDLEHEFRFSRHPVWLGPADGEHERDLRILGAQPDEIATLWIAAPLTGLLVQPIIGAMSDRTWGRFGRRRPYFLVGAILSSLALIAMPNASTVWMAAGLLWILDASINVSMEPFRAFVADKLPEEQRSTGFSMQSVFIGLGAVIASGLPWIMTNWFQVTEIAGSTHAVPITVRYAFYLGAAAFFGAVLWTVLTTSNIRHRTRRHFAGPRKRTPDSSRLCARSARRSKRCPRR